MKKVIVVESKAGYKYPERPQTIVLDGTKYEIYEIVERWRTPVKEFYRIEIEDGSELVISYIEKTDQWFLEKGYPITSKTRKMYRSPQELPFNRCDYRCEKCSEQGNCWVYQMSESKRIKHLVKGEDPDSMETVIEDLRDSLEESMRILKMSAKKWGIDLDKETEETKDYEQFDFDRFPLYKEAYQFTITCHRFCESIRDEEKATRDIEQLLWYSNLISAKVARALSEKYEFPVDELMEKQATISARIVLRSLRFCEDALENIFKKRVGATDEVKDLLIYAGRLTEKIKNEFFRQKR